jgi:hypothetical protein
MVNRRNKLLTGNHQMFQLPEVIKVIKLLFAEPTQEEETEQEWKDAQDIAAIQRFIQILMPNGYAQ